MVYVKSSGVYPTGNTKRSVGFPSKVKQDADTKVAPTNACVQLVSSEMITPLTMAAIFPADGGRCTISG